MSIHKQELESIVGLKPGDLVQLVKTSDQFTKLKPGDKGIVTALWLNPINTPDASIMIDVKWHSGSNLAMIYGVDEIKLA